MEIEPCQWTFSTLGCPDLDLDQVCLLARQWGIDVLELRCLGGRIDLPAYFEEFHGAPERMAAILAAHRQSIQLFDTSFQLINADPAAQQAELLRFVPWAEALGVPFLRVFDGGTHGQPFTPALAGQAAASVRWWREQRARSGWKVDILMETHTACTTSDACLAVEQALDEPLLLLWDSHHTWRAGEPLLETWLALAPFVRHVHVKDSAADAADPHRQAHTLPGAGDFPWPELEAAWRRLPYRGTVSLEWERKWHPELPPLEEALGAARAARWF